MEYLLDVKTESTYTTADGKTFSDEHAARDHAREMYFEAVGKSLGLSPKAAEWVKTSYSGQRLVKQYPLSTDGIWQIKGEDDNPDFGGSHHQPLLDTVEGKLANAIEHAVSLKRFYTWGGGGDITKVTPRKIKRV